MATSLRLGESPSQITSIFFSVSLESSIVLSLTLHTLDCKTVRPNGCMGNVRTVTWSVIHFSHFSWISSNNITPTSNDKFTRIKKNKNNRKMLLTVRQSLLVISSGNVWKTVWRIWPDTDVRVQRVQKQNNRYINRTLTSVSSSSSFPFSSLSS